MMTLKKDKKAFFFDIDGTLAIHGEIPESTIHSLRLLKEKGYYVFICTGRPYHYAYEHYHQYADGFITSNGRYIVYNKQVLMDKPLTSIQIQRYINVMRKHHCGFAFIDQNIGFLEVHDENMRDDMLNSYYKGYFTIDFKDEEVSGYMFDIYYSSKDDFQSVIDDLKDEVILNEHIPHPSADATILGVDKGHGIDYILDYFQIEKDNSYAFGDGSNDLCMFDHVGYSIAMGNAIEALKKEATYVTSSIYQDGIYNALKYYQIID